MILGDFFHNAASRSSSVHRVLTDWRKRHTDLQVELVRGNHDHAAGDPWPDLKVRVHPSSWTWKGFCCAHTDQKPSSHPVLSGHVHPSVKLSVQGRRVYRLPCFWFRGQVSCTLPSFGHLYRILYRRTVSRRLPDCDRWPLDHERHPMGGMRAHEQVELDQPDHWRWI